MQVLNNPPGPKLDQLSAGKVFVLRIALDAESAVWRERISILSPDERARAERYPYAGDAARFAQCRLAARDALGEAIGCPPEQVRIEYSECGKPRLVKSQAHSLGAAEPITFNISHSGDLCLIALGAFECLGIDIEERLDCDDLQILADRFFAPKEAARIRALPPHQRIDAFYTCWTRKEALIKALGHGMGQYGIDKYEVFHEGDPCACLREMPGGQEEVSRWTMQDIDTGDPEYAAAIAVRGKPAGVVIL